MYTPQGMPGLRNGGMRTRIVDIEISDAKYGMSRVVIQMPLGFLDPVDSA